MYENSKEVFTITLIVEGSDSKILLSLSDIPAKSDDEASGIIYKEDLPEQFNEIVSRIPIFKTAVEDDGSEESITHTISEFLDIYELDLLGVIESGDAELRPSISNFNKQDEILIEDNEPYNPFERTSNNVDPSYIDPREALD